MRPGRGRRPGRRARADPARTGQTRARRWSRWARTRRAGPRRWRERRGGGRGGRRGPGGAAPPGRAAPDAGAEGRCPAGTGVPRWAGCRPYSRATPWTWSSSGAWPRGPGRRRRRPGRSSGASDGRTPAPAVMAGRRDVPVAVPSHCSLVTSGDPPRVDQGVRRSGRAGTPVNVAGGPSRFPALVTMPRKYAAPR